MRKLFTFIGLALFFSLLTLGWSARSTSAQELTEEGVVEFEGGRLTFLYPAGWTFTPILGTGVRLTNSEAANAEMSTTGFVTGEDDLVINLFPPNYLVAALGIDAYTSPIDVFEILAEDSVFSEGLAEGIINGDDNTAFALFDFQGHSTLLLAKAFEGGTVMAAVLPGQVVYDDADSIILSILDTVALEMDADEQEAITVELEENTYEVTLDVPETWLHEYAESVNTLYFASSAETLTAVVDGTAPQQGDQNYVIGIMLPESITNTFASTNPVDLLIELTGDENIVESVTSFDFPAAFASVTDTADVFAFEMPVGLVLVGVQPQLALEDASDVDLLAMIESLTVEVAGDVIRQWANSVVSMSPVELTGPPWNVNEAVGEPNITQCDSVGTADGGTPVHAIGTLFVMFAEPVVPTEINIYQNYNPGLITGIAIIDEDFMDIEIPNTGDSGDNTDCPNIFSLTDLDIDFPISSVLIRFDISDPEVWTEIDAVELVGVPAE